MFSYVIVFMYMVFCWAGLNFSHRSLSSRLRSKCSKGGRGGEQSCVAVSLFFSLLYVFSSRLRERDKKNMEYYGGDYLINKLSVCYSDQHLKNLH